MSGPLRSTTAPYRSAAVRAASSRCAPTHAESRTEQPRELARVRREHRRRLPRHRLELEERIGVDHRRKVEALEQPPDERLPPLAPPEARARSQARPLARPASAIVSSAEPSRQPVFTASRTSVSTTGSDSSGTASAT